MTRLIDADAFKERMEESKDGSWFGNGHADVVIGAINDEPTYEIKDDYHTMNELYQHRHVLLALAVNTIKMYHDDCLTENCGIFKSKKHFDGSMFDGMFIVMGYLNGKQFSYHVENKYWKLFKIPEQQTSDEWDGHTSNDALNRITEYIEECL